jgi:N4-gp56 family major capsid protein
VADAVTNFSALSNDAPNVYIAREEYRLAERRMVLGRFAKKYQMPQRMGKTLRVVRYSRMVLPVAPLATEGTPPDAVALATENVDVTVEQWGIVGLITDVAQITTAHPALQIMINRTGMAIGEALEREVAKVLLGGTKVRFAGNVANRAALDGTKVVTTTDILAVTASLRNSGAMEWDNGLFGGVLPPQVENDVVGSDTTFKDAAAQSNIRTLQFGEIGDWGGVRWFRGNFLPFFRGVEAPDTAAQTATKAKVTAVDGGGTIVSATNFKFQVVAKDKNSNYERKISQVSANIASAATGNNESFTVDLPTSTNYLYDVYMSAAGGSGNLFRVKTDLAGNTQTTITAAPAGTEAVGPSAPADTKEVFISWVFGQDAFGRVELDGMSMQAYITPPGPSYPDPLAQGRKVGSKIMWKAFILDNDYFRRIESNSNYSAELAA